MFQESFYSEQTDYHLNTNKYMYQVESFKLIIITSLKMFAASALVLGGDSMSLNWYSFRSKEESGGAQKSKVTPNEIPKEPYPKTKRVTSRVRDIIQFTCFFQS